MPTKFFFNYEYNWPGHPKTTNTMAIDGVENIDIVLNSFKNFLLGCGYVIDGSLEIVPDGDFGFDDYDDCGDVRVESTDDVTLSVSNYGAAQPYADYLSPYVNDSVISFNPEYDDKNAD
jgi:hypothetical protein